MLSRREFLASSASFAVTTRISGAHAAMGPNDKFDLLIKGGDVLDPSQSLRGRRYWNPLWRDRGSRGRHP
jgi:dihydroorotase